MYGGKHNSISQSVSRAVLGALLVLNVVRKVAGSNTTGDIFHFKFFRSLPVSHSSAKPT